ncbi:MAG: winged helix-turn-helix transcriptional regulator [Lysobacteraceae bacterium]
MTTAALAPRLSPDPYLAACPSRQLLARLGEKWAMLIVNDLAPGPKRFGQLARRIEGVSQKMLTQTLRNLERDGLVARTVVCDRPIAVSYALTAMGADLLPIMAAMKTWTQQHVLDVERENRRYDAETASGPVPAEA